MSTWTTPATWASATLTSTQMNTEIRDHLNWLKGFADLVTNSSASDTGNATYLNVVRSTDPANESALRTRGSNTTYSRFWIFADGKLAWGDGSADAADVILQRAAASSLVMTASSPLLRLKSSSADPYAAIQFRDSTEAARVILDYGSSTTDDFRIGLYDGASGSETYYEMMRFVAAGSSSYVNIPRQTQINKSSGSSFALTTLVGAEANPRFTLYADGTMHWGAGGGSSADTSLYRVAANTLATDDQFRVYNASGMLVYCAAGTGYPLRVGTDGETYFRFYISDQGVMSWGPGGSSSADTALYRTGNGELSMMAGDSFNISGSGGAYLYAGTQVVGSRKTGYAAMTNTVNRGTSYDTTTITLPQLASRVKAIQDDLTTHGLIGA